MSISVHIFCDRVTLWTWNSVIGLGWTARESQGSFYFCSSQVLGVQLLIAMPRFKCAC